MKHSAKLLFLAMVTVMCGLSVLTSCTADIFDNTKSLIIGTWELIEEISIRSNEGKAEDPQVDNISGYTITYTFKKDKTWTFVRVNPKNETDTIFGTYKIEGDQLFMLTADGELTEDSVYTIESIDKKNLTISLTWTGTAFGKTYSDKLILRWMKK